MRIERVDAEEERPPLLQVVHQVDPAADHARGRVVVVAVAVDRVPARHRAQPADLDAVGQLGKQVALDRAARGRALERLVEEAVGALRVARARPVERAAEVREARADQERVVGAVAGLDARLPERLGHDRLEVGDRDPAGPDRQALRRHVVAVREGADPRQERAPRRARGHRLRHRQAELERVLRQRVEVRRLVAPARVVRADVVRTRGVGEDQDDVGRVRAVIGGGLEVVVAAGGKAKGSRPGAAGLEDPSTREAAPRAASHARQAS